MDAVMGRGDEDIFEPAHFVDQLGVYEYPPDLGGGVHQDDIKRPEAQEGQGNEVHEPVEGLEDGGTETHRKVHFFGRMMRDVYGPEQADLVIPAMQPIIDEVFGQQEK